YNTTGNELFVCAPVDNNNSNPYLYHVMVRTWFNSTAPGVGDPIEVTFSVENTGQDDINGLELLWFDQIEGLTINDTEPLYVGNLSAQNRTELTRVITKASYRGYFFPAIPVMSGNESALIVQDFSPPTSLGVMNLTLEKIVDVTQPIISDMVIVTLKITNTGTIQMGDLYLDDSFGYDQRGYSLYCGRLINHIDTLDPGESMEFQYVLVAKSQGKFTLRSSQVKYYYEDRVFNYSNTVNMKTRQNPLILLLWVLVPIAIGVAVISVFLFFKRRYDIEEMEQKRREELMFGQSLTEKMWEKENVTQYLDKLVGFVKKKSGDE
ncbi:MAG: hypothetical protein ACTSU5_09975, partial [Promethearchaeota archaeon]